MILSLYDTEYDRSYSLKQDVIDNRVTTETITRYTIAYATIIFYTGSIENVSDIYQTIHVHIRIQTWSARHKSQFTCEQISRDVQLTG